MPFHETEKAFFCYYRMKKVVVIGAGMSGLAAAALCIQRGYSVVVVEQNWMVGGCTATYWRKGHRFESGATTLVGLEKNRPVGWLLEQLHLPPLRTQFLQPPMQVHGLPGIPSLTRFENLNDWIAEAERVFGPTGQRIFWTRCFELSQFVWNNALELHHFPPQSLSDVLKAIPLFSLERVKHLPFAFQTVAQWMEKCGLGNHVVFRKFIDEQLMISAQNTAEQVNLLFGSTALCYTNEPNHYLEGGMQQLSDALKNWVEKNGGEIVLRQPIQKLEIHSNKISVIGKNHSWEADHVISSIPLNNLVDLVPAAISENWKKKVQPLDQLSGAFTMGIAFQPHRKMESIHHQIHLEFPMPQTGANSIFWSTHPTFDERSDQEETHVGAVSMHVHQPHKKLIHNKEEVENAVFFQLEKANLLKRENVTYFHSATPGGWEDWTLRKNGIVGGYPQQKGILPWQMPGCKLLGNRLLGVGDSFYPGQGIPGVILSAKAAVEALGGKRIS